MICHPPGVASVMDPTRAREAQAVIDEELCDASPEIREIWRAELERHVEPAPAPVEEEVTAEVEPVAEVLEPLPTPPQPEVLPALVLASQAILTPQYSPAVANEPTCGRFFECLRRSSGRA